MKLGSIGEFGLIERFSPLFIKNIPEGTLGIGDDCAVIPFSSFNNAFPRRNSSESTSCKSGGCDLKSLPAADVFSVPAGCDLESSPAGDLFSAPSDCSKGDSRSESEECLLVTTDLLLENIHFLKDRISPEELGYKSLAVNLSDIAGMGGKPLFAFLSIGLPKDTEIEWADSFFRGFSRLAEESGTLLMGGDTTGSENGIVINVAVAGCSVTGKVKYRSGAKRGDFICISGMTGESAAGLNIVQNSSLERKAGSRLVKELLTSHNCPRPHIEEGMFLASEKGVHSMMDVSDGIDSDLRHIVKKSGVSAFVDTDSVPLSENLISAEKAIGIDPLQCALSGGEDYCLLLTVDPDSYDDISRRFEEKFSRPLYRIGEIKGLNDSSSQRDRVLYLKEGIVSEFSKRGFDHFSS